MVRPKSTSWIDDTATPASARPAKLVIVAKKASTSDVSQGAVHSAYCLWLVSSDADRSSDAENIG